MDKVFVAGDMRQSQSLRALAEKIPPVSYAACRLLALTKADPQFPIMEIAQVHSKTPAQIALRYLIQQDVIVIPKSVHPGRIQENIDIFDFELSAGEIGQFQRMDTATPMIGDPKNPEKTETAMAW